MKCVLNTKSVVMLKYLLMTRKENFLKIYANIPLNIREEIILVVDDEPITWKVAKMEIDNDTKLATEILKKLEELKII